MNGVRKWITLWSVLFLLCGVGQAKAQQLPQPMNPPRLVNDFAQLLSSDQTQALEAKLEAFDRETSTQIAVVTVKELQGLAPGDFAQRLHDAWGVGGKGKNNGVLLLVKPKTDQSRGEVFISVGYGLEGAIPDITAGRIIDHEMLPSFREGDYFIGIDRATNVLMKLASGEFTQDNGEGQARNLEKRNRLQNAITTILLLAFFIYIYIKRNRKGNGTDNSEKSGGRGMWIPPFILGGGGSRGGGGSFGGFGGFGGGSSGGGGGGRSW